MYYKAVRRMADGRRLSQFIGEDESFHTCLEYKPNGITKAPEGTDGIYCYSSLNEAKDLVNGNTNTSFTGIVEIHEAGVIGNPNFDGSCHTFLAIRLGKCVSKRKVVEGIAKRG